MTWSFPAQALHAHLARRWLQSLLDLSWRDGDAVDRAVHVFGEIASNAVEHAGGRMTVHVSVCGHALRCEVEDPSPRLPEPTDAAADDEHHRGLPLVRALLGAPPEIRRTPDGKVVAFTVRADGAPVAA
ncbi:ATP-binding protein [Streptacidiphilus sp. ASG 303]|uniref:ATP-binding protein n=1 Tax=Streptacidiphilus sp. ASG 303 TaxID=2896847 RepID=UPI001E3E59BB|nr:ATP-binding protein [Streptacidiphilus sp. ASG 303]MCD0480906.1 ATP-binding protein [Streptacidiphilus sp. ASG 303]